MVLSESHKAAMNVRPLSHDLPLTERRLRDAVLATVAYADTFDFPLKRSEVHRDLVGVASAPWRTLQAIDALVLQGRLAVDSTYVMLPWRVGLADLRRHRQERTNRLWPDARRVGTVLSQLPFVRAVAVTGSVAASSPDERADLDYLIITAPGRLWTVRALAVVLVRLARRTGRHICPNYLLSTRALLLEQHDLFTAHELLQAIPLAGHTVARQMIRANAWAADWLPNRYSQAVNRPLGASESDLIQKLGEAMLSHRAASAFEAWEFHRKRARLRLHDTSARFTPDVCEGYFSRCRQRTMRDFAERCGRAGVAWPLTTTSERSNGERAALRSVVLPAL